MTISRDQIDKGDDVMLRVHVGDGVPAKLHRARVEDVLRGAARIKLYEPRGNGQSVMTVRFNQLELVPKPKPEPTPVKPPLALVPQAKEPERADDVDAWLAMGAEFLAPLQDEHDSLNEEIIALDAEKQVVTELWSKAIERQRAVSQKLKRLKTIVEAGKAAAAKR